jgi:alcohol dehydrogenase class IV
MSEFLLKPRICFGQDALSVLNELPARSVLLVTDQAMVKFGLAERVTALLRQRGIAWQVWDDVVADPDIATVVRGMKLMDNHYPDLVIALGGGSVIDAAKAVIFSLAQTRPQAHRRVLLCRHPHHQRYRFGSHRLFGGESQRGEAGAGGCVAAAGYRHS